jgi:hypothetical protein
MQENERALMIVTASALAISSNLLRRHLPKGSAVRCWGLNTFMEQRKSVLQFFLLFPHACALVA